MTDQEIIDLIDSSLAEEFELDPADMTPEANIYEDLGLDSLDMVDMVSSRGRFSSRSGKRRASGIFAPWATFIVS
jgi:hypothetical protein